MEIVVESVVQENGKTREVLVQGESGWLYVISTANFCFPGGDNKLKWNYHPGFH